MKKMFILTVLFVSSLSLTANAANNTPYCLKLLTSMQSKQKMYDENQKIIDQKKASVQKQDQNIGAYSLEATQMKSEMDKKLPALMHHKDYNVITKDCHCAGNLFSKCINVKSNATYGTIKTGPFLGILNASCWAKRKVEVAQLEKEYATLDNNHAVKYQVIKVAKDNRKALQDEIDKLTKFNNEKVKSYITDYQDTLKKECGWKP